MDWVSLRKALGRPRGRLGIRVGDVGMTAVVLAAVELNVATGGGPGAAPLNAVAYLLGAVLVLPVLLRNRYPRRPRRRGWPRSPTGSGKWWPWWPRGCRTRRSRPGSW